MASRIGQCRRRARPDHVPPTRDLPASVLPDPELVTILDQADTAASVGFALAAVLIYLRAERGIRDAPPVRSLRQRTPPRRMGRQPA